MKNTNESASRIGFTLVELLVVIGIISILVALLMPAVQAAREAARRTSCMNNMRQLSLASQEYHNVNNRLEPGWIGFNEIGDPGWGWASFLLPFMEQENLHDQILIDVPVHGTQNLETVSKYIPSMACPSDESSGIKQFVLPEYDPTKWGDIPNPNVPVRVAASNYIVFFSSELYQHPERDEFY